MSVEDFVRLVKVFLKAKGKRLPHTVSDTMWLYLELEHNIYKVMIYASSSFDYIMVSEPANRVLWVEDGVVKRYDYSPGLTERLKRDITLDLLGDAVE